MEEQHSSQLLLNHTSKPLSLLIVTSTIIMHKRDQMETKDGRGRSLPLFKTTTGLVMSKSGSLKDIRLKPTIFGDLLILPDIA
jgi:hypothetical protein